MAIKGLEKPVAVFRITGRRRARRRFDVMTERGLTPLAGRDRELQLLRDCLVRVKGGRGQTVAIVVVRRTPPSCPSSRHDSDTLMTFRLCATCWSHGDRWRSARTEDHRPPQDAVPWGLHRCRGPFLDRCRKLVDVVLVKCTAERPREPVIRYGHPFDSLGDRVATGSLRRVLGQSKARSRLTRGGSSQRRPIILGRHRVG